MIQQMRHFLFGEKGWHLAMKTRRGDLIKHGVRAHPLAPQELEIGPQGGKFSRHGGAFKPTLVQFRQVGANAMVVDVDAMEERVSGYGAGYISWQI